MSTNRDHECSCCNKHELEYLVKEDYINYDFKTEEYSFTDKGLDKYYEILCDEVVDFSDLMADRGFTNAIEEAVNEEEKEFLTNEHGAFMLDILTKYVAEPSLFNNDRFVI
jgi:hypothetical protein